MLTGVASLMADSTGGVMSQLPGGGANTNHHQHKFNQYSQNVPSDVLAELTGAQQAAGG